MDSCFFLKIKFRWLSCFSMIGLILLINPVFSQDLAVPSGVPVSLSLFSESVRLPGTRGLNERRAGWGIRLSTGFPVGHSRNLFHSFSLGYFHHPEVSDGIYFNTEIGASKSLGRFFTGASIGGGYLLRFSSFPVYKREEAGFKKVSPVLHKFMPVIGLTAGYELNQWSLYFRYEIFGEIPFLSGHPILPYQAFHLGTQKNF